MKMLIPEKIRIRVNRKKRLILIYYVIFSLILVALANFFILNYVSADEVTGNDYYVNGASGSDFNDGSFGNPFKSIQKAVNVSSNGDTIYVMAGIYQPVWQHVLQISGKHDSNDWLTIRNYNNDLVTIDGTNSPTSAYNSAAIEVSNSDYIRISGITIDHSARNGITFWNDNVDHIWVDNCSITDCAQCAIKTWNVDDVTIEHNYIYNNYNNWSGLTSPPLSQETISVEGAQGFSLNHNTILNNHYSNIDIKGGCSDGEVCYNFINNSGGYVHKVNWDFYGGNGIMMDSGGVSENIKIYNNYIVGNNTGISLNTENTGHYEYIYVYNNIVDIHLYGGGGDADMFSGRIPMILSNSGGSSDVFHHIYIYNNLFRTGLNVNFHPFQVSNGVDLQDVYYYNNIMTTTDTGPKYMMVVNGIDIDDGVFTLHSNSFYSDTATLRIKWDGVSYTTSSPHYWGNDPVFTDQKFVDADDGDFHLESDSPCIDSGNSILFPSVDYDNVYRPQGSQVDIGPYEYEFSIGDNMPPTINDISIITSDPLDTNENFGWENISCFVSDNVAVDTAYIKITYPDNSEINIEMNEIADSNQYYYNSSWLNYGNYSYYIWAIDTSGNNKNSDYYYFSLPPNWDINNDGRCSVLDLTLISNHYGETGSNGWIREDVDNNGDINILDMSLMSSHFNEI